MAEAQCDLPSAWPNPGLEGTTWPTITAARFPGCDKSKYRKRNWCNTHYFRQYRYGDMDKSRQAVKAEVRYHVDGYRKLLIPGHLLADAEGYVYEHRLILFERIGPGAHSCHWCGRMVTWDLTYPASIHALIADHLDGERTHNWTDNIVPACNVCNMVRARWGEEACRPH